MKKRARIVSGLAALAAFFLAPLTEASLTRATSPALQAPALSLTLAAPEPSEFSLFDGTEIARALASRPAFDLISITTEETPTAARTRFVSSSELSTDELAEGPELVPITSVREQRFNLQIPPGVFGLEPLRGPPGDEASYPKTRYRVFGLLGTPILGELRGVSLELHWRSASFSCELASGTVGWLSEDPLEDRDSPNLYGYVGARPHEKTDPLGLCTPACGFQAATYVNQELTKAGQAVEPAYQAMQGAGEGGAVTAGTLLLFSAASAACGPFAPACFSGLVLGTMTHVGVQNASSRLEAGQTPGQAAVGGAATAVGVAPAYAAVTNKDIVTQQNLGMTAEERARTGGQIAGAAIVGAAMAPLLVPKSAPALPTVRYNRAKHYGGGQTRGPVATALREAGEGKACPTCGDPQVSGTPAAPSPQHEPSLFEHYYFRKGFQMTDEARRAYAGSPEAFNGTQCLTCQRKEGQSLSVLSREIAKALDLD
jgi:hypothetical protein